MKIIAESHTYDGTGRAGFCPLDPVTTQAHTRAGILKAWSKAARAEYARKMDASAEAGVWIVEGYASDGAHRYRMTATAEQGAEPVCGVYDTRKDFTEYTAERERIHSLREKYATR